VIWRLPFAARLGQRGQAMVEYALILVLVAVMVVAILTALGAQLKTVFAHVIQSLGS
jgi:pilus assembly protein Flp/PilA